MEMEYNKMRGECSFSQPYAVSSFQLSAVSASSSASLRRPPRSTWMWSTAPRSKSRVTMTNAGTSHNVERKKHEAEAETETKVQTKCGFATLLGPSNSGKSTLVNHLVGQKVAIVTPKVQTTRCRIAGIATYNETQVVFLDTPGIFSSTSEVTPNSSTASGNVLNKMNRLSRAMVKSAWRSSRDGDIIAIVLDGVKLKKLLLSPKANTMPSGTPKISSDVHEIFKGLKTGICRGRFEEETLCICINKMDLVNAKAKERIHDYLTNNVLSKYEVNIDPNRIFYISARTGMNVEQFKQWVVDRMPGSEWLYEDDDMTDMPSRQLAAEISREKAFMLLNNELPYEIAVDTKEFQHLKDGSIRITQEILVCRESQKRIVTGRQGSVVKQIGCRAREELGEIFGTTVHLMITVKVKRKWKDEKWQFQQWGLDFNA